MSAKCLAQRLFQIQTFSFGFQEQIQGGGGGGGGWGGGGGGGGWGGGGSIAFSHMLSSVALEDPPTILWSPRLLGSLISDMKMSLHLVQKQVKLHLKTEASG